MLALLLVLASAQDLRAELERAVDLPSPKERSVAATELAKLDVPLEEWRAAMRAFGTFADAEPGVVRETVPLLVGAEVEETELFVYVPVGYDPATPAPLLLALHGTGGSGRNLWRMWRDTADALGMLVLCPSEAGRNEGYAFSQRERLSALEAVRWVRRRYNVDENRVHVTGISRGGHMAWDLALRYPDRFATVAPMIGGPRLTIVGGHNNLRYLENAAHLPIRDLQGSGDDPHLLHNLHFAFERLAKWKADAELVEFPELGHDFELDAVDWVAFLGGAVRDPLRERVVCTEAGKMQLRSGWVQVIRVTDDVEEEFTPRVSSGFRGYSDEKQLRTIQKLVDAKTARLEVKRKAPGRFEAKGTGVASFSLRLQPEDLSRKGDIRVKFDKSRTYEVTPSARVLLLEFVERFDRTFLPVAEVFVR